ncbi:hypothetical protein GCM10010836_16150 [Aminobacter aminovorans]
MMTRVSALKRVTTPLASEARAEPEKSANAAAARMSLFMIVLLMGLCEVLLVAGHLADTINYDPTSVLVTRQQVNSRHVLIT